MSPAAPVTVIIPCFNESDGLPTLLTRLRSMRTAAGVEDWRFLFVDDGSTDATFADLLRAAKAEAWIGIVRHHENLGLGAALRTGFAHAASPIICSIDSDCTYAPERLPELTALVAGGADIATASAWHPQSQTAQGSHLRIALSRMVSAVYKLLIGQDVHTFTCLFRAYRRDRIAAIRFRASGFSAVAEIMLRAMLSGYAVREVPMQLEARRFGESKLKVGDAVLAHAHLITMTAVMVGTRQVRHAFQK
jgi:dolichol-phosphate mannosyltransferase